LAFEDMILQQRITDKPPPSVFFTNFTKTNPALGPLPFTLSWAGRDCGGLRTLKVVVNLALQLPELLQPSFSQQGKGAGSLRQYLLAIRFQDALQAPHLLNGLLMLSSYRLLHAMRKKRPVRLQPLWPKRRKQNLLIQFRLLLPGDLLVVQNLGRAQTPFYVPQHFSVRLS
jgi:hypothetical protein